MKPIFSVDVEDWFHILDLPSTPPLSAWDTLPSHVEATFLRLLDIFSERGATSTCFFLGWVAERFPQLVREAQARGHEIACHGYAHRLVYEMTSRQFYEDVSTAKQILEEITGQPVWGYRSAGFSATEKTPWFFDQLMRAGYVYDSSVFPARRGHGGMKSSPCAPYRTGTEGAGLIEFPISVVRLAGLRLCLFGGGYLRLYPGFVVERAAKTVLAEGRPVIFYVHPREISPESPRLEMPWLRRFKCYVNVASTEAKLRALLARFEGCTFSEYIHSHLAGWLGATEQRPMANLQN